MNLEIRNFLRSNPYNRVSILQIQKILPDNAELDRWLEELAAEYAGDEFIGLVLAALMSGRQVDAHHLVRGAKILDEASLLAQVGMKMSGDVSGHLLQALPTTSFTDRGRAYGLFIIAFLHKERGEEIPEAVRLMADRMAHRADLDAMGLAPLLGLAIYLQDNALRNFLRKQYYFEDDEATWRWKCEVARGFWKIIEDMRNTPVVELIPESTKHKVASGNTTIRRSVPRIGRNDPCHCGSGKKYKHCCSDRDRERLRDSSEIAGVTTAELIAQPELHLTRESLRTMALRDVAELDPVRIPPELLNVYLGRFAAHKDFARCADLLEKRGYAVADEAEWNGIIRSAALYGRDDLSLRLIEHRKAGGYAEEKLDPCFPFMTIQHDPQKSWDWIDDNASAVARDDLDALKDFAAGVLMGKHRELGILLCRGVLPLLKSRADAAMIPVFLSMTRAGLGYRSDEDPIFEVMDKLWEEGEDFGTDNELYEVKQQLALKRREVSELKESKERADREIKRTEQALAQLTAAKPAAPEETAELKRLRQKANSFEQQLKERHAETNSLRRALQQKEIEADALRRRAETAEQNAANDFERDAEDDLLLRPESGIQHPVRLIEYPRDFERALNTVPRSVARATLAGLGRLSGGEPAEFVGAVRLKACPSVTRYRIGHYRLLFRLLPSYIQVIDLIPRSELERKVKVLATQYP